MYEVDGSDVVLLAEGIPAPDPGAPMPVLLADDVGATVAYYPASGLGARRARSNDRDEVVVLRFSLVHSLIFGAPNDETLHAHPLGKRGLRPYGAHRVENSSWIRQLERTNRVHAQHAQESFQAQRHFILAFHDTTFECVSDAAPDVAVLSGVTPHQAASMIDRSAAAPTSSVIGR